MSFPYEQDLRDLVGRMLDEEMDAKTIHEIVDEAVEDYYTPDEDYRAEDDACSEEAIEKRNDEWARSQMTREEEEYENFALEEFERKLKESGDQNRSGDSYDEIPF